MMDLENQIINRVVDSGLISIDLEEIYPSGENIVIDIKDQLFQGIILREKDFREYVKTHNWESYKDKNVAIICSEDAIIPTWAYMLIVVKLQPHANAVIFGNLDALELSLWQTELSKLNLSNYNNSKIVIKGCSNKPVPVFAYAELVRLLMPIAASIMYGEPCSTVPLYKRKPANDNL